MAEQNILNGDQQVLEQILGDINEHAEKKERLERMSVSIRDITKEIDSTTKAMEDEISSRISESTDSICAGYDKAVSQDKDTIKQVQADRDKAKMQGIKERIASETASLRAENKSLQNEINEAFIQENIPRIVNNSFFMALYISRKVRDVLVYTLFFAHSICINTCGIIFITSHTSICTGYICWRDGNITSYNWKKRIY